MQNMPIGIFRGDDTDAFSYQTIVGTIKTDLDLTGCKAVFRYLGFSMEFDPIPEDRKLTIVIPADETKKFPPGLGYASLRVYDSEDRLKTFSNRIMVFVATKTPMFGGDEFEVDFNVRASLEPLKFFVGPNPDDFDEYRGYVEKVIDRASAKKYGLSILLDAIDSDLGANEGVAATPVAVKAAYAAIIQKLTDDYYTSEQTDEAIDRVAAYYITRNAAGDAFETKAQLNSATVFYSGGKVRTPTRNDYCVVLADETHDNAEYRYIYAVADGETTGSWQPQFPVEGVMTVDQTVTKHSQNPVSGGGVWSAIWGALAALPTGFASLYDWCVAQLAGKVPTSRKVNGKPLSSDVTLTGADIAVSGTDATKIDAALAGKASTADATLTERFSEWGTTTDMSSTEFLKILILYGDVGGRTGWYPIVIRVCSPQIDDIDALRLEYAASDNALGVPVVATRQTTQSAWILEYDYEGGYHHIGIYWKNGYGWCIGASDSPYDGDPKGSVDSTELSWTDDWTGASNSYTLTATRTALPGYQLGTQTDKPLASEAEAEALRTGKQGALSAQQLANIAAVPNKANDADVVHKSGDTMTGPLIVKFSSTTGSNNIAIASADNQMLAGFSFANNGDILIRARTSISIPPRFTPTILPCTIGGTLALAAGTGHDGNLAALDANGNPTDSGVKASAKLDSTSAAPAFSSDPSVSYAVGSRVTYNGKLYKCTAATTGGTWVAGSWTADTMTDPDAVLDITAQNQLRVVAKDGTMLWAQGYDLASTSSATLACDATNNFTFADGATTQAFTLPTAPTGKVGDFGLDIDNSANANAATMTLTGLDSTFSVIVPEGESLTDMLAIAAGELARFYITLSTFRVNNLPTWHIVKQVVENGGATV